MTKASETMREVELTQIAQQSTYEGGCSNTHSHVLMTQMSVKAGTEKYGQEGNDTLTKELSTHGS